jgi:hypothetical protein
MARSVSYASCPTWADNVLPELIVYLVMVRRYATLAAFAVLVSACGSPSTRPAPTPTTGSVTGRLLAYGGLPESPQGRPFAGHVTATAANGKSFVVAVPADGNFALKLLAGSYALTGSSPEFGSGQYRCVAERKVQVTVGTTSNAAVICHER